MEDRLIIHAYRHLYKRGLQAIRFATPARHVLRNTLRDSFRSTSRAEFDPAKIARTLEFLDRAAASTSYEHKIVKNLLYVRFYEQPNSRVEREAKVSGHNDRIQNYLRLSSAAHFNSTLMLLNESLDGERLCRSSLALSDTNHTWQRNSHAWVQDTERAVGLFILPRDSMTWRSTKHDDVVDCDLIKRPNAADAMNMNEWHDSGFARLPCWVVKSTHAINGMAL